jgi:hypothetical protein
LGSVGCADPYGDAKTLDTIEAYEAYLATEPSSGSNRMMAEKRLEELLVAKAEESKAIADYDKVLKRFPKSKKIKDMRAARATKAYEEAEGVGTEEAWGQFLKENDFADGALKKRAKTNIEVAKFRSQLAISEPVVEQVNLAEDPKGPMNGWGIAVDVTNNATVSFDYFVLEVQYLDDAGKKIGVANYPLVATSGPGGMPIEERLTKPLVPGETRHWQYTTGEPPEGWTQKVRVVPSSLKVAEVAATPPK